jgi:GMP synthase (glutamine-hydrolysing)
MATDYVLQHMHCETPGLISDCLQAAGIGVRYVRLFEGNPVPSDMNDAAGLIVMGGSMSVYDHERFSFLLDEQHLIEQALKDEKPVLGVCLGSQLLAATLGAGISDHQQSWGYEDGPWKGPRPSLLVAADF